MGTIWGAIDRFLAWLKNKLSDAAFQRISAKLDGLQTIGFLTGIGGLILGGLMAGIALGSVGSMLGLALGTTIALFPLGYFAYRFEDACRTVGDADITPLSVGVYLDILVVTYLIVGGLGLLGGTIMLFTGFGQAGALALVLSTGAIFTAWLAACPERIGVRVDASHGAARDLLSLPMVGIRILVRLAVPLSRIGVFFAGIGCLFSGIMAFTAEEGSFETVQASAAFGSNVGVLVMVVQLPFVAYMVYTVYSFLLGFAENILSIKAIARNTAPEGSEQPAPAPAPAPVSEPAAAESPAPFGAAAATPFGSAAAPAPAPAPVAAPAPAEPAGLAPGAACKVQWSDGTFPTGTVKQMGNGQVLVTFTDGRAETWVPEQYVTPT